MREAVAQVLTGRICNLTVMADHMRPQEAARVRVLDTAGLSAELLSGLGISETQPDHAGGALYVIVAGEGLIEESDGATVVVTAGDVVFVPANIRYRFAWRSPKFTIWKIDLTHTADLD